MTLALAFSEPDVDKFLRRLTARQVAEWEAFAALYPFGPAREDYRAGVLAAVAANSNPFRGKGTKPASPADFFASIERPKKKNQTAADMAETAKRISRGMGGKVGKPFKR